MTTVLQKDGVTIVQLGERYDSLDDGALEQLAEILFQAASGPAPPALLIDLSQTRLIGSRFIGVLVRTWKRVQERQGRMGLCCIPPFCRDALVSTRLYDTLWTPYPNREAALLAMKQGPWEPNGSA
ncbi:MAG: STAS domain-containing protein [Thermoguttaceae bacterium]